MAISDEALMQLYQAGDTRAFETLYAHASSKVYGYLKSKLGNDSETDDVYQQVFMKLHHTRAKYDPKYKFEQWLFVIARTTLLDHFRRKGRANAMTVDADVTQVPDPTDPADSQLDPAPAPDLSALNSEQRRVVEYKVFDELTYEEIAARLNRKEASVRQLFSRAVRKLRVKQGEQA